MTIETAMVFALGFLLAALLALGLLGAVWRRAVRLTTRRVENAIPLSMAEIKADKDQLRAEFAVASRRLEMNAEALRGKVNDQIVELARKTEAIRDLNAELAAKAAAISGLEAGKAALEAALAAAEAADAEKARELTISAKILEQKEAEFAALDKELADKLVENDGQRVEIVALRTQTENLRSQVTQLSKDLAEAETDLTGHRQSFVETSTLLTGERQRAAGLGDDILALRGKLKAETDLTAGLKAEIDTLKAEIATQQERATREQVARDTAEQALGVLETERDKLKTRLAAQTMRNTETVKGLRETAETLKAEKGLLDGSLAQARDDRERIQRELAALKRDIEAAKARDGRDSTLLRERVSEVAVEVARVAALLEGPNSKIEAMLADYAAGKASGTAKAGRPRGELSLADRILAVQAHAKAPANGTQQPAE
ncbi:hypothetical protein [Phreatobacter stygius]|uniref:Uncharacterized protein n=1 Tax=Phreatobacter stygius TaxID=1940610 RepID=A0A4D7B2P6_9HYPH|nr:hypothetical protein [Phreatobacter stygius]QCI63806.1 hypothetical protein E8M01_05825 [Phreatobacter stygius]